MKKNLFILFLSILLFCSSKAQDWEWAKNITHGAQAYGTSVGTDQGGNIYMTGSTHLFLGGGGGYYYSLFWKLDNSGNMMWVDTLDGGGKSVTDLNGNTYMASGAKYDNSGQKIWQMAITASYQDIVLYPSGGIVAVGNVLIGNDTKSVLSRYDENGNCLWTRIGDFPAGGSTPPSLYCDNYGNIYWVGQNIVNDSIVGFLAKVNGDGILLSTVTIPNEPTDVVVSSDFSVYVIGQFSNVPTVIGNDTFQFNSKAVYLIKYNPSGNIQWYKIIKRIYHEQLEINIHGNVLLVGSYSSGIEVENIYLTSAGGDIFIMQVDSLGNIVWYEHSVASTPTSCYPGDIHVNSNDEVFITGAVKGVHSFGPYSTTQSNAYTDLLIAKIGQPKPISPAPEPHFPKIKEEEGLLVVTNPSSTSLAINFSSPQKLELLITVKNSLGQTVYFEKKRYFTGEYINTINLSKQPAGIYFIDVICGEERITKKIVIE